MIDRLNLATLPWKNGLVQLAAVAHTTELWLQAFSATFGEREREEITRLIGLMRAAPPRKKARLPSEIEHALRRLKLYFRAKAPRFDVARCANGIALDYLDGTPLHTDMMKFQRAIDQTCIIDVWASLERWRMCDAFGVLDHQAIPDTTRQAFEAIWMTGELATAYAFAESWNGVNPHADDTLERLA